MGGAIVTVDAFTDVPFSGNPAAVCILSKEKTGEWMQKVAREMSLSETAFLVRGEGRGEGFVEYDLRWFTPMVEVDLCGHATLASAHLLWEDGHAAPEQRIRFQTKSGVLQAERREKAGERWIEMEFPALTERPYEGSPSALSKALGAKPRYVGAYGSDYLFEVESESVLRRLSPDFGLLKRLQARGVAVTSLAGPAARAKGYDFVSRFFAPRVGIDEDPVTGSAHCALGPFWMRRLGKEEVMGYQASARGGSVRVRMRGDRAILGGKAVTMIRGVLE